MSTANVENVYNEVTNTNISDDVNGLDPMYHWDTHYPERLSSLNPEYASPVARRSRKGRPRNSARFKTQPITFDEIKEVDEETVEDPAKLRTMKEGIKYQFTAFSRSMDGLMPALNLTMMKAPELLKSLTSDCNDNRIKPNEESQDTRLSPEVVTGDSASDDARIESQSEISTKQLPAHLLSDYARVRRQKRFKKKQRHSRSIEEVPEQDKTDGDLAPVR